MHLDLDFTEAPALILVNETVNFFSVTFEGFFFSTKVQVNEGAKRAMGNGQEEAGTAVITTGTSKEVKVLTNS